jgi:hypothetical protein
MASGDASLDPGRDEGRPDDAGADRDNAGIEPQHVREFFPMMGNSACSRSLVAESIRYGVNPRSGT